MRHATALLAVLLLANACSDSTAPKPQPVPASLQISPAMLALGIGETAPLQASIRDEEGQALEAPPGLQIAWTSSDPTVVDVDATGLARGVRAGTAVITAAAEVDGARIEGRADASVLAPEIRQEASAATHGSVGPLGGTLSATATDGTRYTLEIPEGALLEETEISLTPLAIDHFPGSGAAAAGAHFAPDGLRFYVPATLTVELPAGSAAGAYTGFTYRGEGEELHLYPATADGRTLTYALVRFSGYGMSALTPAEIATFPSPSHAGALAQQALVQLLAASAAGEEVEDEEFVVLVRFWYTDVLRPALLAAETDPGADDAAYLDAELEYLVWQRAVLLYGPFLGTILDAERAEAASLLAAAIRGRIDAHNQHCRGTNDLGQALQVVRFQRVAASFGFDGVGAFGLDPASVHATLCLDVVVEELSFPETIGPGEEGTLELRAGYRIEGHASGFTSLLRMDVFARAGSSGDHLSGTTSETGHYAATVAWPDGEPTLMLDISACLDWGGLYPEMVVCEERQVVRVVSPLVVEATFPDTVRAGIATPLRVRVGRQMPGGSVEYQAGHAVDLAVTGGSATPASGTSDGDGYVDASITADTATETLTVIITVTGAPDDTVSESVFAVVEPPPGQVTLVELSAAACDELIESVAALPIDLSGSYDVPYPFGRQTCTGTASLSVTTQPDGTVVIEGTATAITEPPGIGTAWYLGIRTAGGDFNYTVEASAAGSGLAVLMTGLGSALVTGRTYLACAGDVAGLTGFACQKEENVSGTFLPNDYAVAVTAAPAGGEAGVMTMKLTLTPVP